MSASQIVIEHIIAFLGGTGVVVTGLAAYFGKLLADKSLLKAKSVLETALQDSQNEHQTAIKLLEKELQLELVRKDQFHQISKSTFENIFNKKIDVYSNLLKIKTDYDKFIYEDGSFNFLDPTSAFLSHFKLFRKSIEENRLYISNHLSVKYDDWYLEAAPYFRKLEELEFNIPVHAGVEDLLEAQEPIINNLVENTIDKMGLVINQIECDVQTIRDSVNTVENT